MTDTFSTAPDAPEERVRVIVQDAEPAGGPSGSRRPESYGEATEALARDARRRGQTLLDKTAQEAGQLQGRFADQAVGALSEGKAQLSTQIGTLARSLGASGEQFRRENLTELATFSDVLAQQAMAVEHYLNERSGQALLSDIRHFASRHRGLLIASLVVGGVVAARLLNTSSKQSPTVRRTVLVRPGSDARVRHYPASERG